MVIDWLTAAGIVLALAAAFGIVTVAGWGKRNRHSVSKELPPSFRALAVGDVRDYLEHKCPTELPRRRASDHVTTS